MNINDITNFLESRMLSSLVLPWKILAIIVTALFLYAAIFYFIKQKYFMLDIIRRIRDFTSFQRGIPSRNFLSRAKEISFLLSKENYRAAVLRSELLFYDLLHSFFRYPGKTLMDVVTGPSAVNIPNTDDMVKLAKIAKEMKKDKNYVVNLEELRDIFDSFEDTLRKMDVIIDD